MRKLAFAAALALVAPACTSAADEAGESASSDLTADLSISSVCATDSNTDLNRTGVIYVALCAGTQPSADIQRVDLLSGTRTTIGQYPADQRVTFHDVSADTALWSAGPASPVPAGTARPKSQVSFWTAGVGARSFVPDDVLVNTDYHPSDEAPFQMLGYAGHGRILAIWGRIHPKVGLVDASTGTLTWNAAGPSSSSSASSYVSALRSTDGNRWLLGQTLVDVGGPTPRVVRLADSINARSVYTWAGDTASWDGKSAFALLDYKTYGLVDLDTFVQTKLGDAASTDPLEPGRPAAATDGTIAFLTVPSDHTKRSLQTLTYQREVPSTFEDIEYVAPGGSWAIVAEATHRWIVDLAHPEAAMTQLDDGGRVTIEESHGVLTLTTPIAGQHTLVRRIDADGNASAPVDVAGSVLPLDAGRLLVNGCSSTFDGASVATDASRCLGGDQRTQPLPLADGNRALVRGGTWTDITLSVVRL